MSPSTMAQQALDRTARLIEETGPRLAGTSASLKVADLLHQELETFADRAEKEHFSLHKGAFLGWIRILVALYLAGVVFLWLDLPLVTAILILVGLLILVGQFFLYLPVIDWLYPKKTGCNVIGTIEPNDVVHQQILVSGHHDSARIFHFFLHQPKLYNLRVTGGISLIAIALIVALIQLLTNWPLFDLVTNIALSVGFLLTGQMWFFASKQGTPGAGDNLIASSMAMEIGRHFQQHPLKHTRIVVASFDAEEEGLRGARAYAKAHVKEFEALPTTLLNVDCPYHLDDLFFLTSDINNSVALSTDLAQELVDIATNKGYPATHKPIAFLTGGTDAGELAKRGVRATTLIGMPWSNNTRASVYHTPDDTVDKIEPAVIKAAIDIFCSYIEQSDGSIG